MFENSDSMCGKSERFNAMMRDCESFAVDLSAYFDDELDAKETALVEEHLSGCAACQGNLAKMRRLRDALHRSSGPAGPASRLVEDLMRALKGEDGPGGGNRPGSPAGGPRTSRGR